MKLAILGNSAPRASSNDYESSPMPPATLESAAVSQTQPQPHVLPFSPNDIWSYDLALAGPSSQSVAVGERPGVRDLFSIGENQSQPQASSSTAPNLTSFREATAIAEESDILSIFLDSDPVGSRQLQSETLRQSSCPSVSSNHQGSEGGPLAPTSGQMQSRRTMCARQELRDAKRDYGIPETRDGSRNTSVERDQDQGGDPGVAARLWDGSEAGPSVPGVLSAEDVAELFSS